MSQISYCLLLLRFLLGMKDRFLLGFFNIDFSFVAVPHPLFFPLTHFPCCHISTLTISLLHIPLMYAVLLLYCNALSPYIGLILGYWLPLILQIKHTKRERFKAGIHTKEPMCSICLSEPWLPHLGYFPPLLSIYLYFKLIFSSCVEFHCIVCATSSLPLHQLIGF